MNANTHYQNINSTTFVDVVHNVVGADELAKVNKKLYLKSIKICNTDSVSHAFNFAIETAGGTFEFIRDTIVSSATLIWEDPTGMVIPYNGKFKVKVAAVGDIGITLSTTYIGGV